MLSVGVHIEEMKSLNVVALGYKNRTRIFKDCFSIPLSKQAEETEKLLDIVQALKKVKERYRNEVVRFCFALPQDHISCFVSTFPFSEKFKILKTLPFEIEENTLFQLDNVFFDGRVSSFEKNNSSQVISFVTLKENVKNFLVPLKQLKIEPYLLSAEGAALANLAEEWEVLRKPPATRPVPRIYVHLGLKSSQALFLEKGKLKNVSHFNWNYEAIIKEMGEKYKLGFKEAHAEFKDKAFVLTEAKGFAKEQVAFSDMIQKHLKPLIQELELHKISMETREKEERQFEEIFLTGPGAAIRNLSVYLSLKLSLPVHRVKLLESLFPSNAGNPESLIAAGLAMEGLKQPPYTGLNLIHSFQSRKRKILSPYWITFFLIFITFLFYSVVRNRETVKLADKIHEVFADRAKKIAFIKETRLSRDKVRNFLEEKKKHIGNRDKIKKTLLAPGSLSHLKTLTKELKVLSKKGNLKINLMEIDDRKIHIKGFIDRAFSSQLKLKLADLGENDSLKEISEKVSKHSLPASQTSLENNTNEKKKTLKEQKPDGIKAVNSESPHKKDGEKDSEKESASGKEEISLSLKSPAQEEASVEEKAQVPFSYSFILKKTL